MAHRPEIARRGRRMPGDEGGWAAAAAAAAGGHVCPSPRAPATALAQGGKETLAPSRLRRSLGARDWGLPEWRGACCPSGGSEPRRARAGPRGLEEASRGRGSQQTRTW